MVDGPVTYGAQDEWNRIQKQHAIPGNTPARAMRAALSKMMDPHIREQMSKEAAQSTISYRWSSFQKGDKIEYISSMTSSDDIGDLLGLEPDNDICEALVSRRRELQGG